MAEENGAGAISPLEEKIIKQIEYYFGDLNLPRDRFLQDQISQDEGWVTLETMLKFNRLKKISDDAAVIADALKKSTTGLMEVSEDKLKVRRSPDMPIPDNTKERRDDILARTIYAKGFPTDHSLDQIQEFFNTHGKIDTLQMKRMMKTKEFKGSLFAVFNQKEDAEKFVKAECIKYEDTELLREFKDDYFKRKNAERKEKKGPTEEEKEKEREKEEKLKESIKKATILRVDGLPEQIQREDIKNFFTDFAKVAWVDHEKGETKGYVRFHEENDATTVLEKAKEAGEGKIEINNNEVTARVLEGEEELNHWKAIYKTKEEMRKRSGRKKFGGRGGRSQGGGGHRGRKRQFRGDSDGAPRAKEAKAND